MRLPKTEISGILEGIWSVLPQGQWRVVSLLGSRANPSIRGGDLDLWTQCESEIFCAPDRVRRIRLALQDRVGEQKIDIVMTSPLDHVTKSGKLAVLRQIIPG